MNNLKRAKLAYVGLDKLFFDDIKNCFSNINPKANEEVIYENIDIKSQHFPIVFKKICSLRPTAIILDFGKCQTENDDTFFYLLALTRLLRQNLQTRSILTIAVHDYLQESKIIEQLLLSGVRFNFVKSSENDLLVSQILTVLSVKDLEPLKFATAKCEIKSEVKQDLRIGYATKNYLRVETNIPLETNKTFVLEKHPFPNLTQKTIPVKADKSVEGAQYYTYKYNYHLYYYSFEKEKVIDRSIDHLGTSPEPKWVRVLIIDPALEFIDNSLKSFEELPYVLNIQSDVVKSLKVIKSFKPHIIAVQNIEQDNHAELKKINSEECKYLSFKSSTNGALSTSDALTFQFIEKIYKTFSKKITIRTDDKFFFNHKNLLAVTQLTHEIIIKSFNEGFIYFETEIDLPNFCVFRMINPFKCLITTIPNETNDENLKNYKKAIINFMSAEEVMKIRRDVNWYFTVETRTKREQEIEEFKNLNKEAENSQKKPT